ncbi:calcium activated cation channel [Fomitiporia mediterranea MF3/22]|uniref:calcium activated cation channel n=1 Tax=Fomitiporia mediterranea (strain MF3/22) TaxID=694068 RepID=UPI0004407634|nr:calcium activated cation channel [Fomitiporia mediterranea MF3/22]EJD01312.1 calcium activated cation channel [Fomitiporia mediterranea MF3/22]
MDGADENASLLSNKSLHASPDTVTKLIKRLRALTLKLIPVEVELKELTTPASRIISSHVISTYERAAGDFHEALPYCLLQARQSFMWDANHNAADYDEYYGRAIACEVLARRIVHRAPPDRLTTTMSKRYCRLEWDGDKSELQSALELAIDTHCTIFLSSTEAQHVVNCLWRGDWVQKNNEHHDIDYVPFNESRERHFRDHLDPSRISVPRYQNFFRVAIWLVFLVNYSQAVRQPLERLNSTHQALDGWEIALYIFALSFAIEDLLKLYKMLRFVTWRAFGFWSVVSLVTDALLVAAFVLRVVGIYLPDNDPRSDLYHYKSFQVLSHVAPFIWMKLITIVDGFKWVGTMQICVARMLQESGIFFAVILAIGFAQGLYAIDAADGETEHGPLVINALIQALLQSPDFGSQVTKWNFVTTVILLNVLISLFASAYEDVVDDAEAQYLAYFAGKTVGMIRAPDSYVYPAPFNLIEVVFVAPLEPFMSQEAYAKYNRWVMSTFFFIPLLVIALWETSLDTSTNRFMKSWFSPADEGEEDDPANQDPEVSEPDDLKICVVPFKELVAKFPDAAVSPETNILHEVASLREQIQLLTQSLAIAGKE